MNFRRLLSSAIGRVFISILLGLGLATLFRKVCTDKNCIVFNGPVLADVEGKIFKVDDKCYTYTSTTQKCDSSKKVVEISKQDPEAGVTSPAPSQKSMFGVF